MFLMYVESPMKVAGKPSHPTTGALDQWENEGGATAKIVSGSITAQIDAPSSRERQFLQRRGAAVVTRWNDISMEAQRTFLKIANDISAWANELLARTARFLSEHTEDRGA